MDYLTQLNNIAPIDLPYHLGQYTYTCWVATIVTLVTIWRLFRPPPPPPPPSRPPPPPPPHPLYQPRLFLLLLLTYGLDQVCIHTYPVHTSGCILITGASSGIGRAAAVSLATSTHFTVYAGVRKANDATSIRNERLPNLIPLVLDVTKTGDLHSAVQTIAASKQPLVALVNNAGLAIHDAPIELADMSRWRHLFDVNVFGLISTTQAFLPLLRASSGRIINIGSIVGDISQPMWSPYSSSKHAVEAITDSLRVELRMFDISVSLIKPGEIQTDIFNKMQGGGSSSEWSLDIEYQKTMERSRSATTKETRSLYESPLKQSLNFVRHCATTTDPGEVPTVVMTNNAIAHAITSHTPRTRYVFGGGAAVWVANLVLPDKITDCVHHWIFNQDGWTVFHAGIGRPLYKLLNAVFYW